jgi:hypothetical protein
VARRAGQAVIAPVADLGAAVTADAGAYAEHVHRGTAGQDTPGTAPMPAPARTLDLVRADPAPYTWYAPHPADRALEHA